MSIEGRKGEERLQLYLKVSSIMRPSPRPDLKGMNGQALIQEKPISTT